MFPRTRTRASDTPRGVTHPAGAAVGVWAGHRTPAASLTPESKTGVTPVGKRRSGRFPVLMGPMRSPLLADGFNPFPVIDVRALFLPLCSLRLRPWAAPGMELAGLGAAGCCGGRRKWLRVGAAEGREKGESRGYWHAVASSPWAARWLLRKSIIPDEGCIGLRNQKGDRLTFLELGLRIAFFLSFFIPRWTKRSKKALRPVIQILVLLVAVSFIHFLKWESG